MMKVHWLVLWSLWAGRLVRQPTIPVRVTNGLLRGSLSNDGSHIRYLGIPYASYKRFQAPMPDPTWNGVLEATEEHIRCPQRFTPTFILGNEDCLTLNIYTPVQKSEQLYPVMVFIHGGGFRDGSSSPFLYGPEYLVRHGVILVTINYRLEILGFLCLGIKEAPGNVGLKDQVESLRWVKRNIKAFGGEPNKITIFGESAGAASVLYHVVSPMSKGLFQKAIMQSGSAISPWSLQFDPLKTATKLAKQMGHDLEDPYKLYELFRKQSFVNLLKTRVPRHKGDVILSENIFVPCIERKLPDAEQFLTEDPYHLLSKGQFNKVPVIMGYNSAEGYMFVGKENETTIKNFNYYDALPRDLEFPSEKEKRDTAEKLKKLYNANNADVITTLSKYEGDSCIVYPVIRTVELLDQNMDKPVYVYKFAYDGWLNLLKFSYGFFKYPGATHADDLFYIFKAKLTLPQTFYEMGIINTVTKMWTDFAKYGDPQKSERLRKWYPLAKNNHQLLVIDKVLSSQSIWEDQTLLFWNKTYSKYRKKGLIK
ncbi:unnamed protein product, partial [Brenthis ino]